MSAKQLDAIIKAGLEAYPQAGHQSYPKQTEQLLEYIRTRMGYETTTSAYYNFVVHEQYRAKLRKDTQQDADIAAWYNVNPFQLSEDQKLGLIENLPRVKAQKRINEGNYDLSDSQEVYELFLLATGSEQAAEQARIDAHAKMSEFND